MLKMQNISKVYRAGMVETHALREFSLEVDEGEFISVTGPSGSGKTTFLNIAGLLESFTSGQYVLVVFYRLSAGKLGCALADKLT